MNMHPKVFVSHASEDKERFVNTFATKLRAAGIDAWLDKWEMLPGDSLVDKIFEEGLKEASAVIVVLSKYSVDKPWVREELNAGIVKKITRGTKIIPVVIDDCAVPESLQSTLWEQISNLDSYDESFVRIRSSIFGVLEKPPLGDVPAYVNAAFIPIDGLTHADNLILKESGDAILAADNKLIGPGELFGDGSRLGLSVQEILDGIEVLEANGMFKVTHYIGGGDGYGCHYQLTMLGFDKYANAYVDGYNEVIERIISAIVNRRLLENEELAADLTVPLSLVDHVLDMLEHHGHIKASKYISGGFRIHHVAASLRRLLAA